MVTLTMLPPMRRTRATLDVARELLTDPERARWSYELAAVLAMSRGATDAILKRMREYGWVIDFKEESTVVSGRPPRRYFQLTEVGKQRMQELIDKRMGTDNEDLHSGAAAVTIAAAVHS